MPITQFVGNLGLVGVVIVGAGLAVKGTVNIGDIQAFLQYINQLNQPVLQAANVANVLQLAAAAAERVFDFLGEEEESPDSKDATVLPRVLGKGRIRSCSFWVFLGSYYHQKLHSNCASWSTHCHCRTYWRRENYYGQPAYALL